MAIAHQASYESLMRSEDPVVRFAMLNRPVFHALQALLNAQESRESTYVLRARSRSYGRFFTTVQLLGGISQVRVLLELAKENGLGFDYVGPSSDGLGGDLVIYEPNGLRVAIRVEAKPYDRMEDARSQDIHQEALWSLNSP